jgi:hypothetical protein
MVLARLTKDMTLQTVSAYNFLDRGCGGSTSWTGGQGGVVPLAAWGAWATTALGAEQAGGGAVVQGGGRRHFVSRFAGGARGLEGLRSDFSLQGQQKHPIGNYTTEWHGVPSSSDTCALNDQQGPCNMHLI